MGNRESGIGNREWGSREGRKEENNYYIAQCPMPNAQCPISKSLCQN
ncbi:hypothetical protein COO91_03097 [Nostoc flagelliforme CCNUN1]|uniref:Uncharacterized protein n=2 Tax=Nostoc flagelliforme TaxID=1306274 RepID=A0A2K8SP16_9NOSO|nr:hypothetical protein COO91_03097 [Nostoc flagelliforme CCNUN1]